MISMVLPSFKMKMTMKHNAFDFSNPGGIFGFTSYVINTANPA